MRLRPPASLAALGLLLSLVAALVNTTDDWSGLQTVLWAAGALTLLAALAAWDSRAGPLPLHGLSFADVPSRPGRRELAALALILLVAAALRVIGLAEFPPQLHNDEMSCGLEGQDFLGTPAPSLFGFGWYACPRFGFALIGLSLRLFGDSLFGLRMCSVVLGLIAVVAAHFLARLLFGVPAALVTSAMVATFHWHLHVSRTGFIYGHAVTFSVLALLFFASGVSSGRRLLFGLAGVAAGLGAQTYFASRLVPFVLAAWCLALVLGSGPRRLPLVPSLAKGGLVTSVLALAVLAPSLAAMLRTSEDTSRRLRQVFVFSEPSRRHMEGILRIHEPGLAAPTATDLVTYQIKRSFGLLFRGGDAAAQYGYHEPFLPPATLPVYAAAAIWSLAVWRSPGISLYWIFVVSTIVVGNALTLDPPFSPRVSGLSAILPMLVGAFAGTLADRASRSSRKRAVWALTGLFVALWVGLDLHGYFVVYPRTAGGFRRDRIARLLEPRPDVGAVVNLFPEPENFDYESYRFVRPGVRGTNLVADGTDVRTALSEALSRSGGTGMLVIAPPAVAATLTDLRFETWTDPFLAEPFAWCVVRSRSELSGR